MGGVRRSPVNASRWSAADYAKQEGFAEQGYRAVVNCNEHGGQTVFHLHVHLLAGRRLGWPPG